MRLESSCQTHPLRHGLRIDLGGDRFPTVISAWQGERLDLTDSASAGATHFGFVRSGTATLDFDHGPFELREGMYFSLHQAGSVSGPGDGLVATRLGYQGFFCLGGPIEQKGRLRYIDGCTDSLLVAPVRWGDPCLNLLCFPPRTVQTEHTHPSLRAGVVVRGRGECHTPTDTLALTPGEVFILPAYARHRFVTGAESMTIIAYHPDSDFGPTDDDHPMINRTLVDGRSLGAADPE